MNTAEEDTAMVEQALTQVPTPGPACVVIRSEVVCGRVTLAEYQVSPENAPFRDQCFDLSENAEILQLPIDIRVFEQIAVSKVQTVRTYMQTDVVRREIADVSDSHGEPGSAVGSGPNRSGTPNT